MKATNETCSESFYTSYTKDTNQKSSSKFHPLLKFKENLYNLCQSKFSKYASNKKDDLKLMINSQTKEAISIKDYLDNTSNDMNKLTPIPFINKRRLKNEREKKELKNFQGNVVLMRRLEYANKIKEISLKKKYNNKIKYIIHLQKMIRGYLVRKVIFQVNIIKNSINKFCFLIIIYIWKKYFYIFKFNISQIWVKDINEVDIENEKKQIKEYNFENNEPNNYNYLNIDNNINLNESSNNNANNFFINENKNDIDMNSKNLNSKGKEYENSTQNIRRPISEINEQLELIKNNNDKKNEINLINTENNSENNKCYNDDSKNISEKNSSKEEKRKYNNMFENYINASNQRYYYNEIKNFLPHKNKYKNKVILIQRYFRKFLFQKEFYGKYGKKKVGFFLLKNIYLNNIGLYAFNRLKLIYKSDKNDITQDMNFIDLETERLKNIQEIYHDACEQINFK